MKRYLLLLLLINILFAHVLYAETLRVSSFSDIVRTLESRKISVNYDVESTIFQRRGEITAASPEELLLKASKTYNFEYVQDGKYIDITDNVISSDPSSPTNQTIAPISAKNEQIQSLLIRIDKKMLWLNGIIPKESQKVTITLSGLSVREALWTISKQQGLLCQISKGDIIHKISFIRLYPAVKT